MNKLSCIRLPWQMLLLLLMTTTGYAQKSKVPLLERRITLSISNEEPEQALKKVGQAAGVTFSYKSSLLKKEGKVSGDFRNQTIREALDFLFKGEIGYKERGKYIILVKLEKEASTREGKTYSGYVVDEATGERLKNVSVYDPVSLSSAVTDSYGYFQLEIKNPTGDEVRLAINKNQYADTLFVVPARNRRLLNIPIRIDSDKIAVLADSVESKLRRAWMVTKSATQQAVNMENISDTLYRDFQGSFVPFVGSNGKLSGNVINDYSLNVIGGYSLGIRKAEFGGMFNLVRGDVRGIQVAGLFNGVVGEQRALQLAGLVNAVYGPVHSPQVAGLVNFDLHGRQSVAGAGLINFTLGDSRGPGIAGLINFTHGEQRGFDLAGLGNVTTGDTGPAQVAGLFNYTGGMMKGVQFAGLFNYTDQHMDGTQVAGLFNISPKTLRGAQVSGLFNIAKEVKGTQVGLFNFAKNINGVPVGLLSVVAKGYHKIEISADEIFYTNVSFRSGVRQFYNILAVGAKPETFGKDKTLWTFGYGIGTAPKISKWLFLNFDLTANQVVDGNVIEKINLINKLYGGFDFQIAKNFSITAGVTLNAQITDTTYDMYPELFTDYQPRVIEDRDFGSHYNATMWLGGKIGLRFL